MNNDVHFIITGGTIDSVFSPKEDAIVVNDHSVIQEYLANVINPNVKITAEILTMKDSRDITDNIREEILASIKKTTARSIVVTHGTYTMPITAKFIKERLVNKEKTIVLTGAMLPIKGFSESDATYNLGYAISAAQLAKSGVYLAMNSYLFDPENVEKKIEDGVFAES